MKDNKTIKQPTKEEMKRQKKKLDETIKKADRTLVSTLSEVNLQKYNEAKMLCDIVKEMNQQMFKYVIQGLIKQKFLQEGMLEEYNKKIAEIEKENKENSEDLLLKITIEEIQMTESVEKMIERLNGKFITYNFLLMLPSYFTGIKETDVTYIQELLSNIQTLSEEKKEIMKQFYKLYDEITENNQELTSYMQNIWEELPSSEREIEGKTQKVIDITDKEVFDKYMNQHKNITSGLIDSLQLFEMSRMAETELHLSFDYNKETQLLEIYIQKDLNFSNSYVDITERKVEKLKEEKERLEKEIQELKEEKQEDTDKLDDFKPIPIDKAIAFNDKLSNNLHKLENNQEIEILNTGGKKNKKLQQSVMKVLVKNGEMQTSKILEPFDRVVLQSIYSLIQKNQFFDVQMLKEEMTGNKNRHKGNIDKEIETSLNKLRTTLIKIEIPEELQDTMESKFERVGVEDTILPIRKLFVVKGGHEKSVFGFTSNSIYFDYAKAKGQLISKDTKLLQGGVGNATKETIILTDYITTRIEDMKHQKEKNRSNNYIEEIKFETIFSLILTEKDLQMKQDSLQKKKKRYIEQIKTILQTYKKDRYIKHFEEYSEGIRIKI